MWLTCLVTTVVVCLTVGKGYAQPRTLPTRAPTTRPTIVTTEPPTMEPEGCITRVRSQVGIQSAERRYIVTPKRGKSRREFAKKFLPGLTIQEGVDTLPTVAVISAKERANVSCSRNYKLLYAC